MNELKRNVYVAKRALQFKTDIYEQGERITLYSKEDVAKAEAHAYLINIEEHQREAIQREAAEAMELEKRQNAVGLLRQAEEKAKEDADEKNALEKRIAELEAAAKGKKEIKKEDSIEEFKFANTKDVESFVAQASEEDLKKALTSVKAPTYKSLISKKIEELSA